jgi:hypothetical protein
VFQELIELSATLAANPAVPIQARIQILECLSDFELLAAESSTLATEMSRVSHTREFLVGSNTLAAPAKVSAISFLSP